MKSNHSIQLLSFVVLLSLFLNKINAQCNAANATDFNTCLNGGLPVTINLTNSFGVVLTSGQSLSQVTINVNSYNLQITGNPIVSTSTSVTPSATGSLTITSNSGSAVFRNTPAGGEFSFTSLNTAFGNSSNTNLHAAAIAAGANILPVTLSVFQGTNKGASTFLSWQTSTELNNSKFIIETSTEGEVFNRIGEIAGAGTTAETHDYQFTHHTPSAGSNYYRLKQLDFDGTFAYSKVIAINAPGSNDVFAFPNPAKDKLTLQYDYSKGAGNIQLFDALGRRLKANIGGYAGNYEIQLPAGLAKGTYWLKVERGGKVQTLAVVKE